MRFTSWLCHQYAPGKGRNPQPPNKVPFRELLPLQLKDRVSGKSDKSRVDGCLSQINMLIVCLSDNAYESKLCQEEINALNSCYKKFLEITRATKKAQEKGILLPGETIFNQKQIKKLLEMRPIK